MTDVRTGLENLLLSPPDVVEGRRLGLLCNQASVDRRYCHARVRISQRFPGRLTTLFSPQHGFFGEKQDNMVESDHMTDPLLNIPVYSLYGKTRRPEDHMFEAMDTLMVDLQDVGTRVYTFIYTLSYCMEAARDLGKQVMVLDRPNPIGGIAVEGNCLARDCASFVGRYPLPMRHGLTIGELARLMNDAYGIGCDLRVVPMTGWKRPMYFADTDLPWVAPSPNLPTPVSTMVYPGQVLWEGTNVSEGRGTTQPFELFGAPWMDAAAVLAGLGPVPPAGAVLRPSVFEPTANKWQGHLCRGFQVHVTDPDRYAPYETTLRLIRTLIALYPDRFQWKSPPYEYEHHRLPMDLIIGDGSVRRRIEALEDMDSVRESWQEDVLRFGRLRRRYFLYD